MLASNALNDNANIWMPKFKERFINSDEIERVLAMMDLPGYSYNIFLEDKKKYLKSLKISAIFYYSIYDSRSIYFIDSVINDAMVNSRVKIYCDGEYGFRIDNRECNIKFDNCYILSVVYNYYNDDDYIVKFMDLEILIKLTNSDIITDFWYIAL
jgi:hypothetical protein